MDDSYENKPIELITDDERFADAEYQRKLFQELVSAGFATEITSIYERIDPRYSSTEPIVSIMTLGLANDNSVGGIQISNPYLGLYAQRFYSGRRYSINTYNNFKVRILSKPTAKMIWEGKNNNAKLS